MIHFYYNIDEWELYDLKTDPDEMINQYNNPEYAKIIKELKNEIQSLQTQYEDVMSLEDRRQLTDKYMLKYED